MHFKVNLMYFTSPTFGRLNLEEVVEQIREYVASVPDAAYKLVIGSDSHTTEGETLLVSAIVIHRVSKGARFFFRRTRLRPISDLRQRIYVETAESLALAEKLGNVGLFDLLEEKDVEIHVDIGNTGQTRTMIQEIVGWVRSVGYTVKIKPEAFGASAVADRYTK